MLPVKNFVDFVNKNTLFNTGSKILAAVSGGMDSILLVHLLKAAGYSFGIAHCNFRLRGNESEADEQFCKELAQQFGAPFYVTGFDTLAYAAANKISAQMAARNLRYQWFEEVRQQNGYAVTALAHHQNDAIETILLNLTRGTGIAGLHGILPKNGTLVRPLLFISRDEIQACIDDLHLPYREDSSNASVKYARNKLRHQVIPVLKQLNPSLEHTFENNLQHFRDLETLLQEHVALLRQKLVPVDDEETHILLDDIVNLEPRRLLLFGLLQPYGFNERTIDDLISAMGKHPGRFFESPGYRLIVDRQRLILTRKKTGDQPEVLISADAAGVSYGRYKLNILHDDTTLIVKNNPMAVSADAGLLIYPLTLRRWRAGDHFIPMGMKGRKKVSDFFIGQKVPLNQKEDIPLLVNGNGDVIWIGGYRLADNYKVTGNTEKVVIFELVNLNI